MIMNFMGGLSYLQNYLHGFPYTVSLLLLLVLGLALCFAGRALIKGLAFIITGVIVGIIGAAIGVTFLGPLGLLLGAVVGFIVGGFLGLLVVRLGVGIALGYLGYSISGGYVSSAIIPIVVGVVLFFVGIALTNQLLSISTAVVGGLLVFEVMSAIGFGFVIDAGAAIITGALGAAVQLMSESNTKTKTIKTTQTVQTT